MKLSVPIGRIAGIPLRLHLSFLVLPALAITLAYEATHDARAATWSAVLIVLVFGCILLHELGHCVAARRLGARVQGITLLPIGGVAWMSGLPEKPAHEAWVAIAGPLVNVAIAGVLLPFLGLAALRTGWNSLPDSAADLPAALLRANAVLVLFNLIPAFPMDGGRLLRAALALAMPFARATDWAARIGQLVALYFIARGLTEMPMLAIAGGFVFFAAGRESGVIRLRESWRGRGVREVMRAPSAVAPAALLRDVLALAHAGPGPDFVVMEGDAPCGLLSRRRWLEALREGGAQRPVREVMQTAFLTARADADAGQVWFDLNRQGQARVPVLESGRLVGVLDLADVAAQENPARLPPRPAGRGEIDMG